MIKIERNGTLFELTNEEVQRIVNQVDFENMLEDVKTFFGYDDIELDDKTAALFVPEMRAAYDQSHMEGQDRVWELFAESVQKTREDLQLTKETSEPLFGADDFDKALDEAMAIIDQYAAEVSKDKAQPTFER